MDLLRLSLVLALFTSGQCQTAGPQSVESSTLEQDYASLNSTMTAGNSTKVPLVLQSLVEGSSEGQDNADLNSTMSTENPTKLPLVLQSLIEVSGVSQDNADLNSTMTAGNPTKMPLVLQRPVLKQLAQLLPNRTTTSRPPLSTRPPEERLRPLLSIRSSLEDTLSNHTGLAALSRLQRVGRLNTTRGTVLIRLKQMISGYELYNGGMSVHIDEQETVVYDIKVSKSLFVGRAPGVGTVSRITAAEALSITADAFQVRKVDLINRSWQQSVRLIFYPSPDNTDAPTLCYKVEFYVHPPKADPLSPNAIINATDGSILDMWDGIPTLARPINMTGVGGNNGSAWGQQLYSDIPAKMLNTTSCAYSSDSVRVQNLKGATGSSLFVDAIFPCTQANNVTFDMSNGGFSPLNDLARHGKYVVDMFKTYVGTTPTQSLPVLIRAHYGSGYENAFWDGVQVNVGDGKNNLYPLSAVDVIGHELAHGFTGMYSGLQLNGQPGGINEAFSDMAGETVEYYLYGSTDYTVGRQVTKSGAGIRYMCNPTQDGLSIDNAASFTANMDPHYSSGVFNKAFCVLSKTVNWDVPTAFAVFAYANYVCWQQLTNFTQAACCTKQAAAAYGLPTADVTNAFSVVGICASCA